MVEKETLKQIFQNPDWFVEIQMTLDYSPTLRIQYFGNDEFGAFHLHCEGLLTEQKKFKYISIEQSSWLQIKEAIQEYISNPVAEREKETEMSVNAMYFLKVKSPIDCFEINLSVSSPNKLFRDFVNYLLNFCPPLNDERVAKYYHC